MQAIQITNNSHTAYEIWELYRNERDGRMKERYQVIALMLDGRTAPEVAELINRVRNTTWEWATLYNEGGIENLERKSPPGKTPQLTKEQLAMLEAELEKEPQELGYEFPRWTGKTIAYHVGKCYGAMMGERMAQKWAKRLGFTQQVPEIRHASKNPEAEAKFEADIKKRSQKQGKSTKKSPKVHQAK